MYYAGFSRLSLFQPLRPQMYGRITENHIAACVVSLYPVGDQLLIRDVSPEPDLLELVDQVSRERGVSLIEVFHSVANRFAAQDALDGVAEWKKQRASLLGRERVNWLRVLGATERAQIHQRVRQQLHAIVPLLNTFKS